MVWNGLRKHNSNTGEKKWWYSSNYKIETIITIRHWQLKIKNRRNDNHKTKKYIQIIKKDFYIITISFNFHCFHKTVCQRHIALKKKRRKNTAYYQRKISGKEGKKERKSVILRARMIVFLKIRRNGLAKFRDPHGGRRGENCDILNM